MMPELQKRVVVSVRSKNQRGQKASETGDETQRIYSCRVRVTNSFIIEQLVKSF